MDSGEEQSKAHLLASPIFQRRSSSPSIMPLIIGVKGCNDVATPGTSLSTSPMDHNTHIKSPSASLTLSPNLIFGSYRNLSTSSRSSYACSSALGSSNDSISKSPTSDRYRARLRSSSLNLLENLPTETLEDRIGRWMLWASEEEKRKCEFTSNRPRKVNLSDSDAVAHSKDFDEEKVEDETTVFGRSDHYRLSSGSHSDYSYSPKVFFFSEEIAETNCKLSF